ncbi:MAG: DUF2779 domain-containing protein [Nitrospirota bacterium]
MPAIFEGTFECDQVLVRVDVLERIRRQPTGPDAWRLIEVKSSTRVKTVHLDDLAVQAYVLQGAGLPLAGSSLMHLDTGYVYQGGELNLDRLFSIEDLTSPVAELLPSVPGRLAGMKAMLAAPSPPAVEPDSHCHQPYECPFWAHCTKDKPERWIYHLPGGARTIEPLAAQGVQTIDEIPLSYPLTIIQQRVKENAEWIGPGLRSLLESARYPVHHLDFETFMPAVPKYQGTRPYQAIPTQWSNHVEAEDGTVRHEEYLCVEARDPREELALALLASVGEEGSICVYSGYERMILEGLIEALPGLRKDLERVIARLWDLLPVIRAQYYHPQFAGSYSIKSVLPALAPHLDYGDLEIREGSLAALAYQRMVFEETDWVEKERLRQALLRYCARDTLGMVELRRALIRKASP